MAEHGVVDAVSASTARVLAESSAALGVGYPQLAEIQQWPAARWREVLAVVRFSSGVSARPPFTPIEDVPVAQVFAPALGFSGAPTDAKGAAGEAVEVWHLPGPLHSGQMGRVRYRHNGKLLFACLSISETEFADPAIDAASMADAGYTLRRATEAGYRELFSTIESLHFAHPIRIWNFMPEINAAGLNGERYWYFNGARQDAFLGFKRCIAGNVPAASAVGAAAATPVTIYCISSTSAPISLENPRQRSAWAYPQKYGPRSPTFSRACLDNEGAARTLFISGTSSIVGHESAHAGDECEQTRETLRNIRTMIDAANERVGARRFTLHDLHFKVYVRRPEHQPMIERELRREIGAAPAIFLKADICRSDLLVEIEAVGTTVSG